MHTNLKSFFIPEDLLRHGPFTALNDDGMQPVPESTEEAVGEKDGAKDYPGEEQEKIHSTLESDGDLSSGENTKETEEFDNIQREQKAIDDLSFSTSSLSPEGEFVLLEEYDNELDFLLAGELLEKILPGEVVTLNIYGEKGGGRLSIKRDPPPSAISYIDSFRKIPVHRETKKAWEALVAAARAAGHEHPLLLPTSGYRSTARQAELWKKALAKYGTETEARKWVAKPGGSAHHSGRALDLYLGTKNNKESVSLQRQTAVYQWLQTNAATYGFYPYQPEPWHWEHNPLPNKGLPATVISGTPAPGDLSQFSKAIRLNRKYALETGWIKYYSEINDLLLKTIGKENFSLGEEAFAEAVAVWQNNNGITGSQADGIIGPVTWKKMKPQLSLTA